MAKKSIKDTLMELEVGCKTTFPAMRLQSVRAVASEFGFMTGRKFTVNAMRHETENYVEVTRLK